MDPHYVTSIVIPIVGSGLRHKRLNAIRRVWELFLQFVIKNFCLIILRTPHKLVL